MSTDEIMNTKNEKGNQKGSQKLFIIIFVVILASIGMGVGVSSYIFSESKTTKLGFEDIGELATQAAYCTEVGITDESRKLFGAKIPFTQSKYIYSYDFVVKAGFDFKKINWEERDNTITVELPEVSILSSEPVDNTFRVFYENESIFKQIKLQDNIESIEKMKKQAIKDAKANGLYENAKVNAETMLTAFFGSVYDMDEYKIKFIYKK